MHIIQNWLWYSTTFHNEIHTFNNLFRISSYFMMRNIYSSFCISAVFQYTVKFIAFWYDISISSHIKVIFYVHYSKTLHLIGFQHEYFCMKFWLHCQSKEKISNLLTTMFWLLSESSWQELFSSSWMPFIVRCLANFSHQLLFSCPSSAKSNKNSFWLF